MHKKAIQGLTAMLLSVIMAADMLSVSAIAQTDALPIGASGEIIVFAELAADIAAQNVPLGTAEADLELPDTLTATVSFGASEEETVLDSGQIALESDSADATPGEEVGINDNEGDTVASPAVGKETEDGSEAESAGGTTDSGTEITIPFSVTWASSPEYDGESMGTYVFTPELPEGFVLADGVEAPKITVTVGTKAIIGRVTAFDALPDDLRWQNTTVPEFPETMGGTVEGQAAQIPVTWEADHDYNAEYPQRGLYVFTAVLGEGYALAGGVEPPRITVFVPRAAGRMMARMGGAGTDTSPLEITTAAQLAEIAALVNARASGLELFLFNAADAQVTLALQNDIDLSAYANGEGWTPIGNDTQQFKGAFDGGGNQITGLYINRSVDYQGLFGYVGSGGRVENLGVVNANIAGGSYTGGVAGYVGGMVKKCYSTGAISGSDNVGGVAGAIAYGGTVEGCYSNVGVAGLNFVGGVAGDVNGTAQRCYGTGSVSGAGYYVGGVAGRVIGVGAVKNCAALNPSISGPNYVGRVAGVQSYGGTLSGNITFGGMTVTMGGSGKPLVEGANQVDGASKTAAEIGAAGFFEALFGNDTAWTYAQGKLPGFGAAADMPAHIVDVIDPNFRGAGTSGNPYQISTPAQLAKLAELANGAGTNAAYGSTGVYYQLMNDIGLTAYAGGEGWIPIGNDNRHFNGSFDGGGHQITGLRISRSAAQYQGLFGVIGGTVQNLGVANVNISGSLYVGGVAGCVVGTVQNCYSTGSVSVTSLYAGGVAGVVQGGRVENCYSTGTVSGDNAGGVAGWVSNGGTVQNCYSTGYVSAGSFGLGPAGGVVGSVGSMGSGTVKNCAALNPSVSTSFSPVRRVVGVNGSGTLSGNAAFAGMTGSFGTIANSGNDVNGASKTAAEIGASGFWTTAGNWDTAPWSSAVWTFAYGRLPVLTGLAGQDASMPAHLLVAGALPFEDGGDSSGDPYKITTAAQLAKLAELVNAGNDFSGKHFALHNGLDLSGYANADSGAGWTPIGNDIRQFKGSFNGGGNQITGLSINRGSAANQGLFGYVGSGGKVENLGVANVNITGGNNVGGVAGYVNGGTVKSCYATGSVSGLGSVGGVAGQVLDTVENCYAISNISGDNNVGGVAGYVNGGTVKNCYATGSVAGNSSVGGVAGWVFSGTLKNCAALNPSVSNSYEYGRVAGAVAVGSLSGNYAFNRIPGTWTNKGLSAKDGADMTIEQMNAATFWIAAENWDAAPWSDTVWTFADGKLPTLKNLAGQSGEGGLYLHERDIRYASVALSGAAPVYNGSLQSPALNVAFDGATLTKGTDYELEITSTDGEGSSAGTNVGTVTVVLTGRGDFTGTRTAAYAIEPKNLSGVSVGEIPAVTYTGAEHRPDLTVEDGGATLIRDTDYMVSYSDNTNPGTATATVTGKGNYTGTVSKSFTINRATVQSVTTAVSDVSISAFEARSATTAQAVMDMADLPASVSVATDTGPATLPVTWATSTPYDIKGAEYAVLGTLTGNSNIDPNGVTKSLTITVTPVTAVNPAFGDTAVMQSGDSSVTAGELGETTLPTSGSITAAGQSIAYTIHWNGGQTLDRTAAGNEQTFTGVFGYAGSPEWLTLPGDLTASRRVTVIAKQVVTISGITTLDKTYDGIAYAPGGTVTVSGGAVSPSELERLYESTDSGSYNSSTAPTDAGAYKLTIFVPESNTDYTGSEAFSFTIEKRPVTVKADNRRMTRGNALPAFTYMAEGQLSGETALIGTPSVSCAADGRATGSFDITVDMSGVTGYTANYRAAVPAFVNGTLTVSNPPSSGGDSGDGHTPSAAGAVPEKKPDQPVTVAVSVAAAADQNSDATASIPESVIADAIQKATEAAGTQDRAANGIGVSIMVNTPANTNSLGIVLTRPTLELLTDSMVRQFEVNGGLLTLNFNLEALKQIRGQSTGDVTISLTPVTELSNEAETLIGTRAVYNITFSYIRDGRTVNITSLNNGSVALSIPYTPGQNEAVGYLFGVYIDGSGQATRISGSAYDTNSRNIIFSTNHFSVYGVGYTAPSAKFTDIGSHWAGESIDYVVGRGLLTGTSDTAFSPDTAMTRGMLVTALGRLAGADTKLYTTSNFSDAKAGSTIQPYIEWAYKKGVIQGTGNGKFEPDRAVTREEMAVIFENYAKATGYMLPVTREATAYADADRIGSTYKAAVAAMQQAGIMMGGNGNKFNPRASATRAEVSTMLHRYIKLTIDPATAQAWALNNDGQYLYYKDGKAFTGTQTIDGVAYYFYSTGAMQTGWVQVGNSWYFYSGNIRLTGWRDIGANGNNKTYYFAADGIMVSGKWLQIDGKWYYFNADGSLSATGR